MLTPFDSSRRLGRNAAVVGAMGLILALVGYAAHWPAYVAVLLADWDGEAFNVARRSLHAVADIPKGTVITGEMLISKRPGYGIRPKYLDWVIGRRAAADIPSDAWVTLDLLD